MWAYRTTVRTLIEEILFKLTYGIKAVISIEVGISNIGREFFQGGNNDDQLKVNLDCLDKTREEAF